MSPELSRPPDWIETSKDVIEKLLRPDGHRAQDLVEQGDTAKGYLHWHKFRHRARLDGWSQEELWAGLKLKRFALRTALPLLRDKAGKPFHLVRSNPYAAMVHRIGDLKQLWQAIHKAGLDPRDEASYRLMASIQEAHFSSEIEGAVTTRRQSRELLQTMREPRTQSERMVLNTYRANQQLDEWIQEPLTPDLLRSIQAVITEGSLEDESDVGHFRQDDEVVVSDALTGDVVHRPPLAAELPERMDRLCEFANQEPSDEDFLSPITRAILLHHQLAYDHPFGDGNGRTARTLFQWSILRSGFSWFRNLSVSRSISKSKEAYYRSFQEVQTDEGDVTYFVRYHLRCIEQDIERLAQFLGRRARLARWVRDKAALESDLNARQTALMEHALQHPQATYTVPEHKAFHGVSQPTAWKDLTGLRDRGLLDEERKGRKSFYSPSDKLRDLAKQHPPLMD